MWSWNQSNLLHPYTWEKLVLKLFRSDIIKSFVFAVLFLEKEPESHYGFVFLVVPLFLPLIHGNDEVILTFCQLWWIDQEEELYHELANITERMLSLHGC